MNKLLIVALAALAFLTAGLIAWPIFADYSTPDHPFRVSWSHSHTERLSHSRHTYSRRGDA